MPAPRPGLGNKLKPQAAQKEMGHDFQAPPPTTYLSVQDELLLLHFYTTQAAAVSRSFGLPEVVESTAISYMKRFYLKNSVMEWHPKTIMYV
jgi:cyclin H